METNELPEDVKAKIVEWASDKSIHGNSFPFDVSRRVQGAEFGYRLGLQSREEQLKALMFRIDGFDRNVTQVNETNANLQRELKAKDEALKSLSRLYENCLRGGLFNPEPPKQ